MPHMNNQQITYLADQQLPNSHSRELANLGLSRQDNIRQITVTIKLRALLRLQNSPNFCAFKYARAVKQKVWKEAENRERDWGETL